MTPAARRFILENRVFRPTMLPGLAAWYDVSDINSLRNNAGAVPSSGDSIKLVSDKSGNSGVNVLALNGVAGNYASAPDSVPLSITGDIDLRAYVALNDWTPSARQGLIGKWRGAINDRAYVLEITATGAVSLAVSNLGTVAIVYTSTANPTVSDYGLLGIRATRVAASGDVEFFTSPDFVTWTKLGNTVAGTAGAIFDSTQPVEIGSFEANTIGHVSGLIYRAQIYNGIAGTLVFDANFATFTKLAASGTESSANAATVTINTSGATGARICGARDLYQGTVANQPILTIAASGNYLTFDGSNDYMKAAAFALAQPTTVYFIGQQVGWTALDTLYDGTGASNRMIVYQKTSTPNLSVYAGTVASADSTQLATGTNGVISGVFSGAASLIRINRLAAVVAASSIGTQAPNGFTLGSANDATACANIIVLGVLVYNTAHPTSLMDRVIIWLMRYWKIS